MIAMFIFSIYTELKYDMQQAQYIENVKANSHECFWLHLVAKMK